MLRALLSKSYSPPTIARNSQELERMLLSFGSETAAGIAVTPSSALRSAIVYACIRVLSEGLAGLPCILYRREGRKRVRATDHPLYSLLHNLPNENQTAFEFHETGMAQLNLRGNTFAFINRLSDGTRGQKGSIGELLQLDPDLMTVKVDPYGVITYEYQDRGKPETFPKEKINHVRGMSLGGFVGVSPITYARETIGFNLAAQRHGSATYKNAARPAGVLEMEEDFEDEDTRTDFLARWNSYTGQGVGQTALLEYGIKWKPMSMNLHDAQWLEGMKFSLIDCARLFRMQLHKVQEMSAATYTNIEMQNIEHVTDTMMPWGKRYEGVYMRDLLLPEEWKDYYIEFLFDALLRGDSKSRNETLGIMRDRGIINANEWREKENINPRRIREGKPIGGR